MAASTRAITPTHSGPFSAPNRPSTPGAIGANNAAHSRNSNAGASFGAHLTKSPRGLSPRHSPQPLTGAAAIADERRQAIQEQARQTSSNPAVAVVQNLLGATQPAMSRPKDGPPEPTQMSAALEKAAKAIVIPEGVTGDSMQTSPVSLSSYGTNDLTTAATATAAEATAGPMQGPGQQGPPPPQQHHHQAIAPNPGDVPSNRAFTFPGPLQPEHDPRAPTRQMSLPGYQNSPKSPSAKRHKCPYCSTDFTRHHNLKSHLLTHSQEKPYECPTCQARFRRLHDLKRHTKLHTGERPHTCPKCGRRFARGDALARHNKGQGGCAGRRSSFGIDEDMGDDRGEDAMDGVVYQNGEGEDDEDGDGRRRTSEPAHKRQNTGNSTQGPYHQHSSTYPPLAANRTPLGQNNNNLRPLYPPASSGPSRDQSMNMSPKIAPSSLASLQFHANAQANVFGQGGMTESPKPLSPGQAEQHRLGRDGSLPGQRSPNMPHQILPNFARGTGRGSSPMGLAPPPPSNTNGPHLPSLPGLNPLIQKQGSQGGKGNGPSTLQHQQVPGSASQPGSMSSHGPSSAGSMREVMGNQNIDVWAYVRDMEARMARMNDEHEKKMQSLQDEVVTLRAQLGQQPPGAQPQQQGH